jgi:hypothetical protein
MTTCLDNLSSIQTYGGSSTIESLYIDSFLIKTESGKEFVYKGFSGFKALNDLSKGVDLTPLFNYFNEENVIRIFNYTPVADWGTNAWDVPSINTIRDFIKLCEQNGKHVAMNLLTDDSPTRVLEAINIVNQLAGDKFPNLMLQIGNKPFTHKNINCLALKDACEKSGYIYSSGIYEDNTKFFGQIWLDHSARDNEWPRKAKNLIDAYNGGGPNNPAEPKLIMPCIEDEPIRPDECGYNELDFYAYAAICRACGNGATFHYNGGKVNQLPDANDTKCLVAFRKGLNIFSSTSRAYRRIDELGQTLRTYVFGPNMIRVRPLNKTAPETGWNSLDDFGVCFSR